MSKPDADMQMPSIMSRYRILHAAALCCAVLIASCTRQSASEPEIKFEGPAAQVVANVNGREITMGELEFELERINLNVAQIGDRQAQLEEILRRLVRRTVLAQNALGMELDEDQDVLLTLRSVRSQTLANAFIESLASDQLPISDLDVGDFMFQNAHLFAGRQRYKFDQIVIDRTKLTDEQKDYFAQVEQIERVLLSELEASLKEWNIPFQRRDNTTLGSQIPYQMTQALENMNIGEVFLTKSSGSYVFSELQSRDLFPLEGPEAQQAARAMLTRQRDEFVVRKTVDRMIFSSKIDLFGGFENVQLATEDPLTAGVLDETGQDAELRVDGVQQEER